MPNLCSTNGLHSDMTLNDLINKSNELIGLTAHDIAICLNKSLPTNLTYAKGWMGQAIEKLLGTTAGSKPLPDFVELGIELKTLPVTLKGEPKESTYICIAPIPNPDLYWEESLVCLKTAHILWVPILSDPSLPLSKHRVLTPIFWKPSALIQKTLKQDWEELSDHLNLGHLDKLTAHQGQYLQIRPKAAHSRILVNTVDQDANVQKTVPKGFYFRRAFTLQLLQDHYHLRG
jgi:DNA mismatch repair protein MutH